MLGHEAPPERAVANTMPKQSRRAQEAANARRARAAAYAETGKSKYQAKRARKFPNLELAPRPNRDEAGKSEP